MAGFLDKLSGALNDAVNDVSDKAKEYSEVTSLKGQIRSQEKIINTALLEIAKAYYEENKDNTEDKYYEQMKKITEAQETVDKLNQDIANIKMK